MMVKRKNRGGGWVLGLMTAVLLVWSGGAYAAIQGITGSSFNLQAKADFIVTSDGDSFLMWGYSQGNKRMQYPGPTLIVTQGVKVTVTLVNKLPASAGYTSIIFPGQKVRATGGVQGLLTQEAPPDGVTKVAYTFTPDQPGTYLYRSGTRPDLQVEMGMVGTLIVRPNGGLDPVHHAYNHADSFFDREFLYLMTEMDPVIHREVELGNFNPDMTGYFPTNWFINGRNWPDLLSANNAPWLPTQPYNCVPMTRPNEKVLIRFIGAGRNLHPMHFHGNDFDVIGMDGRMLTTSLSDNGASAGANLAWKDTTINSVPGQTVDFLWLWNAENLGWDIYDHAAGVNYPRAAVIPGSPGNVCDNYVPGNPATYLDPFTGEFCPDHGVPFPVILPERDSVAYGQVYSGSPFLGGQGDLPPGHPGLNNLGAYFFIWHSHREKELTSNDIFPGGTISFMIVAPAGADIPKP
jgi:FtsP/CotA-like multicopper oxidase with cupredoxin domain